MLCDDVVLYVAFVQVVGDIGYLEAALLKIFKAVLKKLVVVGFEANFPSSGQKLLKEPELCGMCETALVVLASGPRIAEVDVNSRNIILGRENFVNLIHVVCREHDVFTFSVFLGKDIHNVSSCNAQHIAFDIYGYEINVGVLQGFSAYESALAAAYLKLNGIVTMKETFPISPHILGIVYKKITGVKLRLSPFLFSNSH